MNSASPFRNFINPSANGVNSSAGSNPSAAPRFPKAETLKIVVVGTPKTGNTWVKHLLAETYGLPLVRLKPEFDPTEAEAAGSRWISHQHFLPSQDLLAWGATQHVVFVCPVRHPGDVLVSLWHHVRNRPDRAMHVSDDYTQSTSMLRDKTEIIGEHTRRFVEHGFHYYLNLSIAWLGLPAVRTVRYEDLWECPVESLRALTLSILPVSDERLRLALCACELGLMQNLLDPDKKFLRQGGTGGWLVALPDDTKRTLSSLDPYPAQFAALGYTMDEEDPVNAPQPDAGAVIGPFGKDRTFADGTPVAPIIMKLYFDLPVAQRDRWSDPRSIEGDSFYNWLNRPAAADPKGGHIVPVLTELAHYLYCVRPDVQPAFLDPFGADRSAFFDWFLFNARQEYGLPHRFVAQNPFSDSHQFSDGTRTARVIVRLFLDLPESMRQQWSNPALAGSGSFLAWLNSPAAADPNAGAMAPAITELGAYLHSIRPDVRQRWPELYGKNRVDFAQWFLSSAASEYELDRAFTLPIVRSWAQSVDRVPPHVCKLLRQRRRALHRIAH